MNQPDPYELWRERRLEVEPPADFADNVIRDIEKRNAASAATGKRRPALVDLVWHGCVAASIALACFGIGLLRIQAFVVLVLSTSGEGF